MKKLFLPFQTNSWSLNCFIKIPQLVMGSLLAFYFGNRQIGVPWSPDYLQLDLFEIAPYFLDLVTQFHSPIHHIAYEFALFSSIIKVFGGIALIFGFATRIISFSIIIIMLVFIINQDVVQFNFTYPLFFISVALSALYFGCGKFGADYLLTKERP